MILGTYLGHHITHPGEGMVEQPFGHWDNALRNYPWDAVTLQVGFCNDAVNEAIAAWTIVTAAQAKNPGIQGYIYETWPFKRNEWMPPELCNNYEKCWTTPWALGPGHQLSSTGTTNEPQTRSYFELVLAMCQRDMKTGKKMLMIPCGEVLYELNKLAVAGKLPGVSKIWDFYGDDVHLNDKGAYTVDCTFYATMFKESPVGLPVSGYAGVSSELGRVIQETAWRVVTSMPQFTGVTPPTAVQTAGAVASQKPSRRRTVALAVPGQARAASDIRGRTYRLNGSQEESVAHLAWAAKMLLYPSPK